MRAAELAEREKYDGVFLDWKMPELDGLELAQRIRQSTMNPNCPIVMITGITEPGALKNSFQAGI
ncbi:MAG: response regulator, partial [Candidatus Acidiferrales bacterium]